MKGGYRDYEGPTTVFPSALDEDLSQQVVKCYFFSRCYVQLACLGEQFVINSRYTLILDSTHQQRVFLHRSLLPLQMPIQPRYAGHFRVFKLLNLRLGIVLLSLRIWKGNKF